ncbi:MAG TPA: transglutaminase-like domain-containing protein [Acidimicrobiia bacterium]|nr:transglutaminase-like domain-containing protein [Acidimicrobiia bacterium]
MNSAIAAKVERLPQLIENDRLAEICLLLGSFVDSGLDAVHYLGRLDQMAAAVAGNTHLALRRVISIQEGIGGNTEDYEHIDNNFLHRVLETRRGVPIVVTAIWIEVGKRAGIKVEGVGLPGHFLAYAAGQLVDPFHFGEAIGRDEAARLVAESIGGPPRLEPTWLNPVDTRGIVRRMLANLEARYPSGDPNQEWVKASQSVLA